MPCPRPSGSKFAPSIPALSETSEIAGFSLEFWAGLFGPAKLPMGIVDRLTAASARVLEDTELKAKLAEQAFAFRKLAVLRQWLVDLRCAALGGYSPLGRAHRCLPFSHPQAVVFHIYSS